MGRAIGLDGLAHAARPLRQAKKSKIEDVSEVFRAGLDILSSHQCLATALVADQCFFIGDEGQRQERDISIFSGDQPDSSSVHEPEQPSLASAPLLPGSCSQAQELGTPVIMTPSPVA